MITTVAGVNDILSNTPRGKSLAISSASFGILSAVESVPKESDTRMKANVFIAASAGTGKTQALAERLIALVKGGLEPHEIVALTFSRAAAGEIFERFVSLLAERAKGDPSCAALLRKVIATQHLSQIGTLDSFLMRIVRSFPLELGLDGGVEIMDDYRAGQELARTSFSILRRTDASARRAFTDAFSLAMNGEDVRSFIGSYRDFVKKWQSLVRANQSERAWGDASSIWGESPTWAATDEKELSRLADDLVGICDSSSWPEFVEWVRNFRGSFDGLKGFAKKFFEMDGFLSGATIDVSFNRKAYSFGGAEARAVRAAIIGVCGFVVRRRLEFARGVYRLISEYEKDRTTFASLLNTASTRRSAHGRSTSSRTRAASSGPRSRRSSKRRRNRTARNRSLSSATGSRRSTAGATAMSGYSIARGKAGRTNQTN